MFKAMFIYFVVSGLVGSLSVCTVAGQSPDDGSPIYQNLSVNVPEGSSKIIISNELRLDKEHCIYFEEEAHVFKKKNVNMTKHRLASCPSSKYWATDSIIGVITSGTMKCFKLDNASISFKCSKKNTSRRDHQFDLHTELEVAMDKTAMWKPFDLAKFIVICTRNDSQRIRHVATINIVYEIVIESVNSSSPKTEGPDNPPTGTGPTNSIDNQQASESSDNPALVTPTEEVENVQDKKKETDGGLGWYFIPVAIILSLLFRVGVVIIANLLSRSTSRCLEAPFRK